MSVHDPDCLAVRSDGGKVRRAEPYGGWPLPEIAILLAGICAALLVAFVNDLPILLPSQRALGAFGVHYLVPVVTLIGWGLLILRNRQPKVLFYLAAAFVCYLGVLIVHFNLKLWVTAVNGANHDAAFMQSDRFLQPVVDACFAIRHWLAAHLGNIDAAYLFAFIAMFYASFIVHAVRDIAVFRKLVVAVFCVHLLGAAGYLAWPALGPFIYEDGANAVATAAQAGMQRLVLSIKAGGADWLAVNGQANLLAGPAAMPSLHTAVSAIFVIFAWRHERWLRWAYLPLFAFILVEAVATRWHYVVDLAAGGVLAFACVAIADLVYRPVKRGSRALDDTPWSSADEPKAAIATS